MWHDHSMQPYEVEQSQWQPNLGGGSDDAECDYNVYVHLERHKLRSTHPRKCVDINARVSEKPLGKFDPTELRRI